MTSLFIITYKFCKAENVCVAYFSIGATLYIIMWLCKDDHIAESDVSQSSTV